MTCDCHTQTESGLQKDVLVRLLVINAIMAGLEFVVGILAESSGVIADSLDMLADALVYGLALYAVGHPDVIKARVARWSGLFQVGLAVSILVDVVRRAVFGSEPHSLLMTIVSIGALAANAYCLVLLSRHRRGEVHMRASWIFTRSDVIANLGVLAAAGLVAVTGSRWPDLLIGAAISAVIVAGGLVLCPGNNF